MLGVASWMGFCVGVGQGLRWFFRGVAMDSAWAPAALGRATVRCMDAARWLRFAAGEKRRSGGRPSVWAGAMLGVASWMGPETRGSREPDGPPDAGEPG